MYHELENPFGGRSRRQVDGRSHTHAWGDLADCASWPTQSETFLDALERHLLHGSATRRVQVPDTGPVIAAIALCRDKGIFAPWRMAGDDELFEPIDALCRGPDAAARLAGTLVSLGRAIDLGRIPASSRLVAAMRQEMRGRGLCRLGESTPTPYLLLDASWCAPEGNFSSRRRSDFRRAQRRAEEFGAVDFTMHAPASDEFDMLFDVAIAIEARSWKSEAGSAILCDPRKEAFFREYLRSMCAERRCRIAFMRIDGTPVATQLAIVWNGRYWLYKIGFDEAFGRCSPGNLLMHYAVGEAARAGLSAVEFMGEAEPWITDLWPTQQHEFIHLRAYPLTPAAIGTLFRDTLNWLWTRLRRSRQ